MSHQSKISSLLSSPTVLEPIIVKSFAFVDKDGNGFIECHEVLACVDSLIGLVGIDRPHHTHIEAIFKKVAGPTGKISKADYAAMVRAFLQRLLKTNNVAHPH